MNLFDPKNPEILLKGTNYFVLKMKNELGNDTILSLYVFDNKESAGSLGCVEVAYSGLGNRCRLYTKKYTGDSYPKGDLEKRALAEDLKKNGLNPTHGSSGMMTKHVSGGRAFLEKADWGNASEFDHSWDGTPEQLENAKMIPSEMRQALDNFNALVATPGFKEQGSAVQRKALEGIVAPLAKLLPQQPAFAKG